MNEQLKGIIFKLILTIFVCCCILPLIRESGKCAIGPFNTTANNQPYYLRRLSNNFHNKIGFMLWKLVFTQFFLLFPSEIVNFAPSLYNLILVKFVTQPSLDYNFFHD